MPVARKGRASAPSTASPARSSARSTPIKKATPSVASTASRRKAKRTEDEESGEDDTPVSESDDDDASEDAYEAPSEDGDTDEPDEEIAKESEVDSDFLDEEDEVTASGKKRKAGSRIQPRSQKKIKAQDQVDEDGPAEEDDESEVELGEGQTLAMKIHSAPKTGHVPAGQISKNTMNFLLNLQDPKKNDRDWFKSHEPSFRLAEKEWVAFVEALIPRFREIDEEIPAMPAKDLIHRIYRDVRFSPDKTPYKRNLSTSMSRGGRKGIWAGYFVRMSNGSSIKPNHGSILAAGVWAPQKNELATFRYHITQDPDRFRKVISESSFVKLFGPAKPHAKGKRQNVFGNDDMLKVAPKGVAKDHKDIDLLRLRSIAVVHQFDDSDVLSPDFMDKVIEVAKITMPLVHLLNEYISLPETGDGE